MIIFHEGMPRSGKSYASIKDHMIPALQKGREVWARLDGLDYDRIAEAGELEPDRVRELLKHITEQECHEIWRLPIPKDALVVIDELQNYWPQQRAPLSPEMTKFIAEHGHHGWDILTMGQLLKDCHRQWVNRTNRKLQFIKKDMLGKPDDYKWIMFTGNPDREGKVIFKEVSKGDGTYDPKYFGCYKSHSEGTENTATYVDARAVIWNNPMFKKWLPLLGIVSLLSIGYIVYLFNGGLVQAKPEKPVQVVTTTQHGDNAPVTVVQELVDKPRDLVEAKEPKPAARADEWEMPDLVTEYTKEHRIRLAGVIRSARSTIVEVEWRDGSMKLIDSISTANLRALGWTIMVSDDARMAVLAKPGYRYVMTAWDIPKPVAKASDDTQRQIREESRAGARGSPAEGTDAGQPRSHTIALSQ